MPFLLKLNDAYSGDSLDPHPPQLNHEWFTTLEDVLSSTVVACQRQRQSEDTKLMLLRFTRDPPIEPERRPKAPLEFRYHQDINPGDFENIVYEHVFKNVDFYADNTGAYTVYHLRPWQADVLQKNLLTYWQADINGEWYLHVTCNIHIDSIISRGFFSKAYLKANPQAQILNNPY